MINMQMIIKFFRQFSTIKTNKSFKEANIIFIRHAESSFNKACIEGAQLLQINDLHWDNQMKNAQFAENVAFNPKFIDCSITSDGIKNSKKTAQHIKNKTIDVVLVSPKLRALQTCDLIFQDKNVPIFVEPLLAESCRFSCDAIKKGTLPQKIQKFSRFDFSKVKQQRVAYNIQQQMIEQYDRIVIQKGLKSQKQKQILLAKMISEKKIYENDQLLRKRAWKIKELLIQYSHNFSNICVVSHWYVLAAVLSKKFSDSSQNLDYVDAINCKPYFYKLSELLKVK